LLKKEELLKNPLDFLKSLVYDLLSKLLSNPL